ncbi:aconitate hydratase AcnA [Paracoccus rhizosphaerae]|uniref:Aconitate hydratase A n=1 Tax=Paracoccus rhizosphaerae TaxID=1133347 RepID=A0ABV6CGB9_9RHOB|nr:aconitate hydratase AcnA [Paracoccus rhizosphaerae]
MSLVTTPDVDGRSWRHTDLKSCLGTRLPRLPHVLRLLSENHLRETQEEEPLLAALDDWLGGRPTSFEFMFRPNRILMHDTTCTPALADIAGLRDAVAEAGGDPAQLTPQLPVEVSVDHSLAVDVYASPAAFSRNAGNEIQRNAERYAFMKWASANMEGVHVNPPGTGIMHTINLEQLATVLELREDGLAHPDMLLGTDSHTPMINGIGVMAWGVGGLEAESVMFGQAASLAVPEVVGVQLTGALPPGVLATDLALEVTHQLRLLGVTGSFVEFFGPGLAALTADQRAVVANMAPEYGASTGFFPVDAQVVDYLQRTGRPDHLTGAIEPLFRSMGLWFDPAEAPRFDRVISIDLSALHPVLAGPRRPQDRVAPAEAQVAVEAAIGRDLDAAAGPVPDGAVGVAAITSCTNTSDPRMLMAAGLLARKAKQRGLRPADWVKTSLAPGSPSARDYLERAGLLEDLAAVGFDIVGFGCTTCIGNSGPLPAVIETALAEGRAISAVLSGNRNFPGRVHPKLDLGYLASPPMVVAYAIRGTIRGDILTEPLGQDGNGKNVYLSDLWPTDAEIEASMDAGFRAEDVPQAFARASANEVWQNIEAPRSARFPWDPDSRDLRRPKFASLDEGTRLGTYSAVPLMVLGDDMTTDHISPAGWIDPASKAGEWLIERGGDPKDLNVYASYRGNWEVMLRGLYTNRLARNYLSEDLPPAWTVLEDGTRLPVFEAADRQRAGGQSVVVLAGERYGMGSSRDWAAKGVALLGVRAVIANSFERIHRTNLIGMGILPIELSGGFRPHEAGIKPRDRFTVEAPVEGLVPRMEVPLVWLRADGRAQQLEARAAVETRQEVELLQQGGVLAAILNRVLKR